MSSSVLGRAGQLRYMNLLLFIKVLCNTPNHELIDRFFFNSIICIKSAPLPLVVR